MKILIAIHTLELGGSQINAIELAELVAARDGYEVEVFAPDGVLADRIREAGIPLHIAPAGQQAPAAGYIAALARVVRGRGFDLIHCYEWDTTINAMYGAGWLYGIPVISTVYSMDVPYLVPAAVPLIVGTRSIQLEEGHRASVALIEPPVDVALNAPGATGSDLRREWAVADDETLVVVVCRLAARLKLEGLLSAIRAVGSLDREHPLRFLVVGDGPSRGEVAALADAVNAERGREVVTMVGERADPRSFYDGSDIAIGMGASALRSMAFAKPLLVQGEGGFWKTLTPESLPLFLEQGFYGVGDGADGTAACERELTSLLELSAAERDELGAFGRSVIERSFSLEVAVAALLPLYAAAIAQRLSLPQRVAGALAETIVLGKHRLSIARQTRRTRAVAA